MDYLTEVSKKTKNLITNSEEKRKLRAENCIIHQLSRDKEAKIPRVWKKYDYVIESAEKEEAKEHEGYIVLNSKNSVTDLFCDCADFGFRWHYVLNMENIASWDVFDGFKAFNDKLHNRKYPHIMNPELREGLCKHLITALDELIN